MAILVKAEHGRQNYFTTVQTMEYNTAITRIGIVITVYGMQPCYGVFFARMIATFIHTSALPLPAVFTSLLCDKTKLEHAFKRGMQS